MKSPLRRLRQLVVQLRRVHDLTERFEGMSQCFAVSAQAISDRALSVDEGGVGSVKALSITRSEVSAQLRSELTHVGVFGHGSALLSVNEDAFPLFGQDDPDVLVVDGSQYGYQSILGQCARGLLILSTTLYEFGVAIRNGAKKPLLAAGEFGFVGHLGISFPHRQGKYSPVRGRSKGVIEDFFKKVCKASVSRYLARQFFPPTPLRRAA